LKVSYQSAEEEVVISVAGGKFVHSWLEHLSSEQRERAIHCPRDTTGLLPENRANIMTEWGLVAGIVV
jgi:hypothetical protein